MKKVLIDVNILDKEKIEKIIKSNLYDKIGKSIKLYVSEICLKQRLTHLYEANLSQDYDYYIDFMKKYCENDIIDASFEIIKNELDNNFKNNHIYSKYKVKDLQKYNSPNNRTYLYSAKNNQNKKIKVMENYKSFISNLKKEMSDKTSENDWKIFCNNFIDKYNFAKQPLNNFIENQFHFNKDVFIDLVSKWWEYAEILETLKYFNVKNADEKCIEIINNNNIPHNSFLYKQIKNNDFLIEYTLRQNKKIDNDTPNDVIYISHMRSFNILLTDDKSFMKSCFDNMYQNKNKQILNLNTFLKRYG